MIPSAIEDAHGSAAERVVFDALQSGLPEGFFCYHGKALTIDGPRRAQEGEIDFVILHRELGLLALEVKGGGLGRDGQGKWYRTNADGKREPLDKDPFAQVAKNMRGLVDKLESRLPPHLPSWKGKLALPFGYAVLLPDVLYDEAAPLPSSIARVQLLDARCLETIEQSITAAMQLWAKGRDALPAREFKRFRKRVFHPALSLVPSLGARIRRDEATLLRLTDKQRHVLHIGVQIPRARIEGPAGAGKTILAMEKAQELAAAGHVTGFVCYNRPLADRVAAAMEIDEQEEGEARTQPSVRVNTYHGFCAEAAKLLGRPFDVPKERDAAQRFWAKEAPELLLEAGVEGLLQFDALVVDEAQDLLTEWWLTLEAAVGETNPIWIFLDDDQDIYRRASSFPGGLVPLRLEENCRATRRLRELCDDLVGRETRSPEAAPEGDPHEVIHVASAAELRKALERKVESLLREGVYPEQIVILAPHTRRNTSLAEIEFLAHQPIVEKRDERGLLFSTARRFKGLESDVVLLIDQDAEDAACTAVHRYVAASRTKHQLIVFSKGAWPPS